MISDGFDTELERALYSAIILLCNKLNSLENLEGETNTFFIVCCRSCPQRFFVSLIWHLIQLKNSEDHLQVRFSVKWRRILEFKSTKNT